MNRASLRAVGCGLLLAVAAIADNFTINFDNVADGTVINNAYPGVTFSNPLGGDVYARSSIFNTTPNNVVSIFQTGLPPFYAFYGAVDAAFGTPVTSVSIDAAAVASLEPLGTPQNRPFLQAFDGATLLGTVFFSGALPTNPLEVTSFETLTFSAPSITSIRFSSQQGQGGPNIWGLFDTLNYTTPTTSPVPEPTSLALLAMILIGAGAAKLRRQKT